jgi:uncharacterized Zn finger protein (UPF0148 family)
MFCSNCGKPLITGASFCQTCGARVVTEADMQVSQPPAYRPVQQQVTPPLAPAAGEDTYLLLKVTRKLSLTNAVVCHLVFRQNQLVLAHLSAALQKAETARLQEQFKAQNVGLMKRTAEQMHYWANFHQRYFSLPTGAILAEDSANQAIYYGQIAGFEFYCYSTDTNYDDNTTTSRGGKLHISLTNGDTLKFTHQQPHDRSIENSLTLIFGQRLKYRR